jgi:hypothetical protein
MSGLSIQRVGDKIILGVKVVPGSSRTSAAGLWNGMLRIKVAAPPEKNKANEALVRFLAAKLNLRARDITIISGQIKPVKRIQITGNVDADALAGLSSGGCG